MNRLVLSAEQSAFLRQAGVTFAVVHPGSYPANVGRYVLDLIECDYKRAVDAVEVATGQARATRPRSTPTAKAGAATGHPESQGDRPPPPVGLGSPERGRPSSATSPRNLPRHHDSQGRHTHTETP
jgi:hypothetical protein